MALEEFSEILEAEASLLVEALPVDEPSEVTKQSQIVLVRYDYCFEVPLQSLLRATVPVAATTELVLHM